MIEGHVKETELAEKEYTEAIESGHSAFLVEEKLPDVFKVLFSNHCGIETLMYRFMRKYEIPG